MITVYQSFMFPFIASGIKISLLDKEARQQWETCFNEAYIQPTLLVRKITQYFFIIAYPYYSVQNF